MPAHFTQLVRAHAEPALGEFLPALRRPLWSQMQKRGLGSLPPAYLGYDGPSWKDAGLRHDLLTDCALYVTQGNRYRLMRGYVREGRDIEGVVIGNIGHFLTERQRAADPVGHAVFKNLEAALAMACEAGVFTARRLEGGRIRGRTRLAAGAAPAHGTPATASDIRAVLGADGAWLDLLPHLARRSQVVQSACVEHLRRLVEAGIVLFRCQDLVEAVKSDVRAAWSKKFEFGPDEVARQAEEGEESRLVRIEKFDRAFEDLDSWLDFTARTRAAIERLDRRPELRSRVLAIFDEMVAAAEELGEMPAQRELGRRLAIPKSTLSEAWAVLREALSGHESRAAVSPRQGGRRST